jgi:hypothetical protein
MNTTDMYTREKATQARQAEIERHIRTTALLGKDKPAGVQIGRGWLLAGGLALAALLVALLAAASLYLLV